MRSFPQAGSDCRYGRLTAVICVASKAPANGPSLTGIGFDHISIVSPYNALRLATSLIEGDLVTVHLFFIGEGTWYAVKGQTVPEGARDIEWMLRRFLAGGREAAVCGTCMDARGISEAQLIEDSYRSTLQKLKSWTLECERVLVF